MSHSFEQTITGTGADEIETKAREAVVAFYGDLTGVEWDVSTDAQVNLAGKVVGYIGRVTATWAQ